MTLLSPTAPVARAGALAAAWAPFCFWTPPAGAAGAVPLAALGRRVERRREVTARRCEERISSRDLSSFPVDIVMVCDKAMTRWKMGQKVAARLFFIKLTTAEGKERRDAVRRGSVRGRFGQESRGFEKREKVAREGCCFKCGRKKK